MIEHFIAWLDRILAPEIKIENVPTEKLVQLYTQNSGLSDKEFQEIVCELGRRVAANQRSAA
jgi:hypothetical protein